MSATTLSDERRSGIAAFLRARRERLRPEQVGLPNGSRRRTPGLRREEVAALARVSTEWYKWLEQGRAVRASEEVLRRIGAALRLEPGELRHLLTLSGYGHEDGAPSPGIETITPLLQRLLDQLEYSPAWVLGERWDILAWNRAATVIFGDIDAMHGLERNAIHQMFIPTRIRSMLVDWELHARDIVAKVRLTHARHIDDPWFNEVIEHVRARSPEFARWWDEQIVQLPRDGTKHYDHPDAGRLSFDYTVLDVADERFTSLHLALYLPTPGSGTLKRMQELFGLTDEIGMRRSD
ncbi:MAG TPA: helix-turn-helix transcriptional regulator [Longimicrobiales bacterium]